MPVDGEWRDRHLLLKNARVRQPGAVVGSVCDVLCERSRIRAVGQRGTFDQAASDSFEHVDLDGRTLLPAFIDSHQHLQKAALVRKYSLDFLEIAPTTVADAVAAVARRAEHCKHAEWIRGDSLNHEQLAEGRLPSRDELDRVAPDNPVVLFGLGNHVVTANSKALAAAGIDERTVAPPGGRIEKDEDGLPNGVLWETAKLRLNPNLADSVLPKYSFEDRMSAVREVGAHLLAHGITTVHDIVTSASDIRVYTRLRRAGQLPFRVQLLVRGIESQVPLQAILDVGLEQMFGDDWLRFGGVKFSIDGSESSQAAAVYEPYGHDPGSTGLVRISQPDLDAAVLECHRQGLRVAVHAIGQRAVDMALDAFTAAFDACGRGTVRHRIEHAYLPPRPGQLARIRRLELIVSTQPTFLWSWRGPNEGLPIGGRRADMFPLRTMHDLGITVAGNSDYPQVPLNPFFGISAAVSRRTGSGHHYGAAEALTVTEAIDMYTLAGAYSGYEELDKGSIVAGKLADLVVVDRDPWQVAPDELAAVTVAETILDGRVVYRGGDF